jgi:antitoxin (DNA-binding transcriptional repressor) of toxin-antitoxin stability system
MSEQISTEQLRSDIDRIVRALDRGESFVITYNGSPVAELRPFGRDRFTSNRAAVAMFRNAAPMDAATLRNDLDEVVHQDLPDRS